VSEPQPIATAAPAGPVAAPDNRRDFLRGLLASLPLWPGVAVFGLLYGVMARNAGLTPWQAWGMSLLVHAGSAQFTAVSMWTAASAVSIVLTTLVINLRHLLMGASVAPYLRGLPQRWKALLALWMSDESYALAMAQYEQGHGSHFYFFGANVGLYLIWPLSGLTGAWLGAAIPDPGRYGLDMIFPLAFLGLLMSFLKDRGGVAAALSGGVLALVVAALLPGKWYVLVAGLLGSLAGLALDRSGK
jgi:4-azaleucine resistance transporter AzlC